MEFSGRETALKSSVYGAAAGDLSPLLSAGFCDGTQNTTTPSYEMSKWCVLWEGLLSNPVPKSLSSHNE